MFMMTISPKLSKEAEFSVLEYQVTLRKLVSGIQAGRYNRILVLAGAGGWKSLLPTQYSVSVPMAVTQNKVAMVLLPTPVEHHDHDNIFASCPMLTYRYLSLGRDPRF